MIFYGCAVTEGDTFARFAEAGVRRLTAVDSEAELIAQPSAGSISRNYNLLCERVAPRPDLEALVLIHQDVEIVDPDFAANVRRALADPEVAIVGCAGAVGVRSIAWWEGSVTWSSLTQTYDELGGPGEIPGLSWRQDSVPSYAGTGKVDSVDGCVLVLSPWAVRNLRFDESLGRQHGYDLDICLQARAAGKKVVTESLRVVHHHSLELLSDPEAWIQAHIAVAEKWEGTLSDPAGDSDWRGRALRAEAEASAYRLMMGGAELQRNDARGKLVLTWSSASWRLTSPLRRLGRAFRWSR
jgi:hypothetical protein